MGPNANFLNQNDQIIFKGSKIVQWSFIMLGNEINVQSKNKIGLSVNIGE
jgi:hypothetical protein